LILSLDWMRALPRRQQFIFHLPIAEFLAFTFQRQPAFRQLSDERGLLPEGRA
jgi:hypothetical protein